MYQTNADYRVRFLGWLAAGMSPAEILDDFPELTEEDIRACLEFAADREHRLIAVVGER